jgi:hypothetical protein
MVLVHGLLFLCPPPVSPTSNDSVSLTPRSGHRFLQVPKAIGKHK